MRIKRPYNLNIHAERWHEGIMKVEESIILSEDCIYYSVQYSFENKFPASWYPRRLPVITSFSLSKEV